MNDIPLFEPSSEPFASTGEQIAKTLTTFGWGVFVDLLPPPMCDALLRRATEIEHYRRARVGQSRTHRLNQFVRRDRTAWIDGRVGIEADWLTWAEQLRIELNRTLYLGLDRFESHFAHYPPGAFYRKHVDAFKDSDNRVVSLIVYLNPDWSPADGGQLALYDQADMELAKVPPTIGTVAAFLSDSFPHEVMKTTRDRYSIAGWFCRREHLPVSVPP